MKILDSKQDFYEYDVYMYGEPDTSVIWDRFTHYMDFNAHHKSYKEKFDKLVDPLILKHYSLNGYRSIYNRNFVAFSQALVGIYPYVYLCVDIAEYNRYSEAQWIIPISESEFKDRDYIRELVNNNLIMQNAILPNYFNINKVEKEFNSPSLRNITHKQYNDSWIKECPELFKHLNTPTFMININSNCNRADDVIVDAFIIDTGLLKHYTREQLDQNIYSNIEQFIIEKNTMEIKEPDNKTKIINAGFDLKTSFRNIK